MSEEEQVVASKMDTATEFAKARDLGIEFYPCICRWPECRKYQILYSEANDPDYSGQCISLRIGGNNEKNEQWRKAVGRALDIVVGSHRNTLLVAKHHFDRRQIRFAKRGARLSTPLPKAELEKYAYKVDTSFFIKAGPRKYDEPKYFNAPNFPTELVAADYESSTREFREQQKEFKELQFKEWLKSKAETQQQLKEKDDEIAQLKEQLAATKHELQDTRNKLNKRKWRDRNNKKQKTSHNQSEQYLEYPER